MLRPPRPVGEGVLTPRMWRGIVFVGVIMALGVSLLLQLVVIYAPFLQRPFGTVGLTAQDWTFCAAVASSVLWLREISKLIVRGVRNA